MHFFGHPHPARAFAGRLPRHFYRHPHPARAFMRDTRIPRRQPPPHPRLRRSSPAPRGGQGQCVAISGEQPCLGRCLVCNRALVFSGISPCAGPWGYRHGGEGLTGRGNSFPLPCLPHSNHLTSRRHPLPAPPAGRLPILLSAAPTPPAPAALLPRPQEGAGSVLAISGEQPCPGATLEVIS